MGDGLEMKKKKTLKVIRAASTSIFTLSAKQIIKGVIKK